MKEEKIRIAEMAALLSLPEDLIRQYADEYDEYLAYTTIGKVRLYDQSAVRKFRVIADLSAQGLSRAPIISVLKGGRSLGDIAASMDESSEKSVSSPPPSPSPELGDEALISLRRTSDAVTRIDQKIGVVRDGMTADTERIIREISLLREEVESQRRDLRTLWSQIRELEEDLRERELRKSWLERLAGRLSR
ncbi:hypothetical protein RJ53_08365 [Methanocalculus chunghsingensis]|uniref:HTH merR-type domain-containing protein n=1 Tax=Methanocalculus chunghsingensis TaxID=156457 RepID=A0A8J7W8M5_9EURY|nr:MerR family transcriptional regulator [Methanocalculus chunghsingensis]MBR1369503.1 hypothetical protein [Methanocalculus chunghsingensis]